MPDAPEGWSGPVVVSDVPRTGSSTPQRVGEDTFVSWGFRNEGDVQLADRYFVDLYFDGVVINRWTGISLAAQETAALIDWPYLNGSVVPTPGVHVLKLVLDSTNLINESDETDNTYEIEVVWAAGDPVPGLKGLSPVCPTLPSHSCEVFPMLLWQVRTPKTLRTGR